MSKITQDKGTTVDIQDRVTPKTGITSGTAERTNTNLGSSYGKFVPYSYDPDIMMIKCTKSGWQNARPIMGSSCHTMKTT